MRESALAIIILIAIIALGIFARISSMSEPMWLDECHTAWTVDADSPEVVADRAADGNQPPLYFLIVWAVTSVFGITEFALRLTSLVAGSLLMIVAAFWAKHLTNRWSAACLVAGLLAFDGQFIFYATEARSYAFVQLIGLLQAFFFWRILVIDWASHKNNQDAESRKPLIHRTGLILLLTVWTLLSIALLYCHYTSVWLLVSEAAIVLLMAAIHRRAPTKFIIAAIMIAASLFPVFRNAAMVFDRRNNWSSVSSNGQLWIDVEPWLVHWILIPIGFAFAAWMISFLQPPRQTGNDKGELADWILWTWLAIWASIGPVGLGLLEMTGIAPMALVRYSIVCWVAMALFAALPLKYFSTHWSWCIALVILGSSFFGNWWTQELAYFRQIPAFRNEDWVSTVSQLHAANSDQPVFQLADVIEDIDALSDPDPRFQDYLLFPILGANSVHGEKLTQRIVALPTWNVQFTDEHLQWILEAKGCWLIVRGELDYAVIIPGELERYLGQSIEFKFLENSRMPSSEVHLIRVRLAEEPAK